LNEIPSTLRAYRKGLTLTGKLDDVTKNAFIIENKVGGTMPFIELERAISFIRQEGRPLDLLRLRRALGEPFDQKAAQAILASYQFPNGSWDYQVPEEAPSRIGSLGGTIHCLRWVREFSLGTHPLMTRTLKFLSAIQAADGVFYETEAKLAHSPQRWLQEETLIDHIYFTAAVPMRLFSLGYSQHPLIPSTLEWLQRHWTNWEMVAGTWYGPWALLCVLSGINRQADPLYQQCYDYSLNWLPRLGAQPLTWLLDALHGAGFTPKEPLVAKALERLESLQAEDGMWPDPQYSIIETTITALRLFHDYRGLGSIGDPS
jgi:hypothetical protein